MALSNNITAIVNFVALLCSVPIIASGIWLAAQTDNECIHWLRWPLVVLGLAFLLVTLAGFVGAYWKKEGLLGLYLVCMFILIALLLSLLVLAFVVTRPDGAYPVDGMASREYRLGGYSSWLRDRIADSDSWRRIRACLADSQICSKLAGRYVSAADFFAADLSPIESGCCKPPVMCGLTYSTPTTWVGTPNVAANPDCAIWNNDPSQLCYSCDSCKAGLLGNLRHEWRRANVILIITVVVLIFLYVIACSAYKNAQTEELFRRYKRGWA
ncbi:Tetraspanin-2 [Striga hermonthica]|uniref:Tetraspanin-2 n=1 Tax=Striga hermonthica TaxID=68872 RepID=A0A9N7P3P5_STRHE|nr:Tetraspanin-2 [Striga hermonthica]